jgi:hypothetical protein
MAKASGRASGPWETAESADSARLAINGGTFTLSWQPRPPADPLVQQLRAIAAEQWPPQLVADYLARMRDLWGRVLPESARALNEARLGASGLLACEECGAIFNARNSRPLTRTIRCGPCAAEVRANLAPHRRRGARAYWQYLSDLEPCVGCITFPDRHPDTTPDRQPLPRCLPALVERGDLYCSSRCRKRVRKYLDSGGRIHVPRAGYPNGLALP